MWTHNTCCSSVSRYLVLGWPEVGTLEQWWLWNEIELQTNLRLKLYYENCDLLILLSSHPSPLCEDELRCARWWPGWAGLAGPNCEVSHLTSSSEERNFRPLASWILIPNTEYLLSTHPLTTCRGWLDISTCRYLNVVSRYLYLYFIVHVNSYKTFSA